MNPQVQTQQDLERILTTLRVKMKERYFSQVRVQQALGWKGSYMSQLFNFTKALRVSQLLQILGVIGIEPTDFLREIFDPARHLDLAARWKLLRQVRDGLQASCVLCENWLDEGSDDVP